LSDDVSSLVDELRQYAAARPNPLAIRMEELRHRVETKGGSMAAYPMDELERKLALLDVASREYVLRQLNQGLPAVVYRASQPGEPKGKVPMAFVLVQLPTQATAAPRRAPPAAPPAPSGNPVDAILQRERQRAGLRFAPFLRGSSGQGDLRATAQERIAAAFAQRSAPDARQGERIVGAEAIGRNPAVERFAAGTGLRPAGIAKLAIRELDSSTMYAYGPPAGSF
jgi:hypothetical protein